MCKTELSLLLENQENWQYPHNFFLARLSYLSIVVTLINAVLKSSIGNFTLVNKDKCF